MRVALVCLALVALCLAREPPQTRLKPAESPRRRSLSFLRAAAVDAAGPPPTLSALRRRAVAMWPSAVDAALAGVGLGGTFALMGMIEAKLSVKLLVPPMMASGIIFFSVRAPPHPRGFLSGTFGCASLSLGLLSFLTGRVSPAAAQGAAAGALLVWYKATKCMFPPAAVLSVLMMQASAGSGSALSFVLFPWLAGHGCLYASALGVSAVRTSVVTSMSRAKLRSFESLPEALMRDTFVKFDTSGDGYLDASELKLALRVALKLDLSIDDCTALIRSTDKNGDGVIDYGEFKTICGAQRQKRVIE